MLLIGTGAASTLGDVIGIVPLLNVSAVLYAVAGLVALLVVPSAARVRNGNAAVEEPEHH